MSDGNWDDLAAQVAKRRKDLRLPIDLSAKGGPTEMTVRGIEAGEGKGMRPSTKTRLETALEWRHGTVDRVLDGTVTDEHLTEHAVRVVGRDTGRSTARGGVDYAPAGDTVASGVTRGSLVPLRAHLEGLLVHARSVPQVGRVPQVVAELEAAQALLSAEMHSSG